MTRVAYVRHKTRRLMEELRMQVEEVGGGQACDKAPVVVDKPSPAFAQGNVPVVFAANDAYVPYLATMMLSIARHSSRDHGYDLVVLHRDITKESLGLLRGMLEPYPNFSLRLVDVSPYTRGLNFYTANREDFTEESYYRLLIPEVMERYDKVLYLDGDMVALTDVAELYEATELGDDLLASSRDLSGLVSYFNPLEDLRRYRSEVLGLRNPEDYFVCGMLVLNVPAFRAAFAPDQLLGLAASREWRQHDQDVLNVACEGRARLVSASWDVIRPEFPQRLPVRYRRELDESVADPRIVHFGGPRKPWADLDVPFAELFWRYAAQTPFVLEIVRRLACAGRPPVSPRVAMEEEFRQGRAGARYILRYVRAWFEGKLGSRGGSR